MENYPKIAATVLGIHIDGHLISSLDTGNHGGSFFIVPANGWKFEAMKLGQTAFLVA